MKSGFRRNVLLAGQFFKVRPQRARLTTEDRPQGQCAAEQTCMIIVREHADHISRRISEHCAVDRTHPDILSKDLTQYRGDFGARLDAWRAQFEGTVCQSILSQRNGRHFGNVAIVHTAEASFGGPRFSKNPPSRIFPQDWA